MARYQVLDSTNRKINIIEWDGVTHLGPQYINCSITPDDGSQMWTPPPVVVSRRQMMLALYQQGKLITVQAIVNAASLDVQLQWNAANEFDRTNDLVAMMAHANGWSEADLDALFSLAGSL